VQQKLFAPDHFAHRPHSRSVFPGFFWGRRKPLEGEPPDAKNESVDKSTLSLRSAVPYGTANSHDRAKRKSGVGTKNSPTMTREQPFSKLALEDRVATDDVIFMNTIFGKGCVLLSVLYFLIISVSFSAETKFPKTVEQYEMIRAGLAADELASAKNGATNLVVAVQEELPGSKALLDSSQKLAASESLDDARAAFQIVSTEVAKLIEGRPGFFVMTCPMVKGSVWVQTTQKIGNPYKGKAMLECGEIKR
jgi:hypothetical protein